MNNDPILTWCALNKGTKFDINFNQEQNIELIVDELILAFPTDRKLLVRFVAHILKKWIKIQELDQELDLDYTEDDFNPFLNPPKCRRYRGTSFVYYLDLSNVVTVEYKPK